jgi:hypothetical protein
MDPVRSSVSGGVVATAALAVFLLVADALLVGPDLLVFATFTSLCAVGGPPYCDPGTPTASVVTFLWFAVLFAVAWPLLFGGFTWAFPGESGATHGALFGLFLWAGYAAASLFVMTRHGAAVLESLPILTVTLLAYLVYGTVLGGAYDRFAAHRTFLSAEAG